MIKVLGRKYGDQLLARGDAMELALGKCKSLHELSCKSLILYTIFSASSRVRETVPKGIVLVIIRIDFHSLEFQQNEVFRFQKIGWRLASLEIEVSL